MNGIGLHLKGTLESSLFLSLPYEDTTKSLLHPAESSHQNKTMLAPDLGLPASKTRINKILLSVNYPVYGILLQQPELTKT